MLHCRLITAFIMVSSRPSNQRFLRLTATVLAGWYAIVSTQMPFLVADAFRPVDRSVSTAGSDANSRCAVAACCCGTTADCQLRCGCFGGTRVLPSVGRDDRQVRRDFGGPSWRAAARCGEFPQGTPSSGWKLSPHLTSAIPLLAATLRTCESRQAGGHLPTSRPGEPPDKVPIASRIVS